MQTWQYIALIAALLWVLIKSKKLVGQRRVMNRRVTVRYLDHNPEIEPVFPLTGTVARQVSVKSTNFFVIELDHPFEYEDRQHGSIVVRERIAGQSLGFGGKTEVHILLPNVKLDKARYAVEDFDQVCWGTAEPLE